MKRNIKSIVIILLTFFSYIHPQGMDQRIISISYWAAASDSGFVPREALPTPPPAVYLGSGINSPSVLTEDSPDVAITEDVNTMQSENSVFVNPFDNCKILNSNNSTDDQFEIFYTADGYHSTDCGNSWDGNIQGVGGSNKGDPATAIDTNNRYYVGYIAYDRGQGVAYSDDEGITWIHSQVAQGHSWPNLLDKNHLWVDNSPVSQFEGILYSAWTNMVDGSNNYFDIELSHSDDHGISWTTPINISSDVNAGSHNQGVNIQTGPNGEVYAVWAIYDNWPDDEVAIGFAKSTDGGQTFGQATRIIDNIRGIRDSARPLTYDSSAGPLNRKNMRVNSFPVMAVDFSGGENNGNIYVVWSNVGQPGINTGNDIDIYLIKSVDGGVTWTSPQNAIKINQDVAGLGKQHFFPWITCDPVTGNLAVIFYDDRDVADTDLEVYAALYDNAGETWSDFRISDVSFTPEGYGSRKYFGDYLGIASRNGKVYPVWTDNRSGRMLTYISPFTFARQVVLTNRLESDQTNLGGTLYLDNLGTPGVIEYPEIFSSNEEPLDVELGANYTAKTLDPRLGTNNEYKHHQWETSSDYLLEVNHIFQVGENALTANFDSQGPVTITTSAPVSLQLHDPWYLQNPNDPPENWVQPDAFRPLSQQDDGSGTVQVFLGQNENFYSTDPIYQLKAPQLYATVDGIYEFDQWSCPGCDFGSGSTTTTNRQTDVVFLTPGTTVTAVYNQVNNIAGYTATVPENEVLSVPQNANILLASGL